MRTYIAFYNRKQCEVQAKSSYAAQYEAAHILKVPASKVYMIVVMLADVTHSTSSIG